MFKKVEVQTVMGAAICNPTENYFILQSLMKAETPYKALYSDLTESVFVLVRKTGTIQVFRVRELLEEQWLALKVFLETQNFTQVIGVRDIYMGLKASGLDCSLEEGAWIAYLEALSSETKVSTPSKLLTPDKLDAVVSIYQQVFHGFASKAYMTEKLSSGRGRGYCIFDKDRLVSVAQSDFECQWGAVIVGVATDPTCVGKGYATQLVWQLCHALKASCDRIGLIYENESAGRIYERLGFVPKDRLYHMRRSVL